MPLMTSFPRSPAMTLSLEFPRDRVCEFDPSGIELATGRYRQRRAAFVEQVFETLTIEEYTLATARAHSRLLADVRRSGRPRRAHDLIIAATSASSERILLTADERGFEDLPGIEVRILER
jgi:tRNA(fMet)-specific endonuclease VapC